MKRSGKPSRGTGQAGHKTGNSHHAFWFLRSCRWSEWGGEDDHRAESGFGRPFFGYLSLNADDLTLKKLKQVGYKGFSDTPDGELRSMFIQAAEETYAMAKEALASGVNVRMETVLSTDKFCHLVETVLESGGRFGLIYVALNSPSVSQERVARRFKEGGHSVPSDRLEERWRRSLKWLPWFASRAQFFYLFDNSDSRKDVPPLMLARLDRYNVARKLHWLVPPNRVFGELKSALSGTFPREVWPSSKVL